MTKLIALFLRWYSLRCPLAKGKGRVVEALLRVLGGRYFIARMNDGINLWVRANDLVSLDMFFHGTWEPGNAAVVKSLLQPGDWFVDVGANIGYFTLLGASIVGETGGVCSFEPMPSTYDWLARNIELNGSANVHPLQMAATDHEGHLTLHFFPQDSSATASQFQAWRDKPTLTVDVPATTLDAQLKDIPEGACILLKVDAEGGELAIFRGAATLLKDRRPLLMFEFFPALAQAAGWTPPELLDLLAGYGYSFWVPEGDGLRPFRPESDTPDIASQDHIDIFAYCPDVPWHAERFEALTAWQ